MMMTAARLPDAVLLCGLLLLGAGAGAHAQRLAPAVVPAKPTPFYDWDVIPTAFHGANKSGVYGDEAVAQLAKHQMVTIEKCERDEEVLARDCPEIRDCPARSMQHVIRFKS